MRLKREHLLYITIFIEGYAVLATELLAIRLLVPFIDNSAETISVIIGSVLISLAFGYHAGSRYVPHKSKKTLREKLIDNLTIATIILGFGLSQYVLELMFGLTNLLGTHRLIEVSVYSAIFLVTPIFLLGQTIPLISNYFSKSRLSHTTGRMLFFSTIGSFSGSIISTIVLMSVIGVNNTVIVSIGLLVILIFLLSKEFFTFSNVIVFLLFICIFFANSNAAMRAIGIIENNKYSTISIIELPEENARIMAINGSPSSKFSLTPGRNFNYVQFIEDKILKSETEGAPKDILVIGAGGFTMGLYDKINHYTYIDIDGMLKNVAEEHFLKQPLGPNKTFIPEPARDFLRKHNDKYDIIIIDAYLNPRAIPFQLITREFFKQAKAALKLNATLAMNVITRPDFSDAFSVKFHNTFSSVFLAANRVPLEREKDKGGFALKHFEKDRNIIYIYHNTKESQNLADRNLIYTDDKNSYYLDR